MSAPIAVKGVEFIEFAANEAEARDLTHLLASMGFAHAGRHITKDVDLYRTGDVDIVVNTERESFAHSEYGVHGTCVCDIGLNVQDAPRMAGVVSSPGPTGCTKSSVPRARAIVTGI